MWTSNMLSAIESLNWFLDSLSEWYAKRSSHLIRFSSQSFDLMHSLNYRLQQIIFAILSLSLSLSLIGERLPNRNPKIFMASISINPAVSFRLSFPFPVFLAKFPIYLRNCCFPGIHLQANLPSLVLIRDG